MQCYRPLTAYRTDSGAIVFTDLGGHRSFQIPCGRCIGCKLERSRQWAVRCMHEAALHGINNCFITLTYDPDHVPRDFSLNYRHFQLFMKRVRRSNARVRFYMCGEYGEMNSRPHYHACLFGLRPDDLKFWRMSPSGCKLYRSASLERCWDRGQIEVGDVTFESAAYIARYIVKKITGPDAEKHYEMVDSETGEVYSRIPEFTRMSLKPGIGHGWFQKYRKEVFPLDRVVVRGVETRPPRYYTKLLDVSDPVMAANVEFARYEKALKKVDDNTEERLKVKESVCLDRVKSLKRSV